MPEYVMVFLPPLVVHNILPFPITVYLSDNQAEQSKFDIDVGGFVEVYQFDLARKIRMYLQMQVNHTRIQSTQINGLVSISHSYIQYFAKDFVFQFLALIKKARPCYHRELDEWH